MEENLDHVTAEWARKTSQTQLGAVAKKQVESVLNNIKEAVRKNQMSTTCHFTIDDIAKKQIEARGFKVEYNQGDFRDPRDSGYYTITW